MNFPVKTTFAFDWTTVPDVPTPGTYTASQFKALFNERDQELLDYINLILTDLSSVTALLGGSRYIGSETIAGVTGNTVYDQIASIFNTINQFIITGVVPLLVVPSNTPLTFGVRYKEVYNSTTDTLDTLLF